LVAFFDTRTLAVVLCATMFTLGGSMVYYSFSRKTYAGFGMWTIGSILSATGLLLIGLRGILPDFFSIVLANAAGLAAVIAFYLGFVSFAERKANIVKHLAFAILYTVVLFPIFTYFAPSLSARIILASFAIGLYFLLCTFVYARATHSGLVQLNKMLMATLILLTTISLVRCIGHLLRATDITDFMTTGIFYGLTMLLLTVLSIAFVVGLMQFNSQKLEIELIHEREQLQEALNEIKTLKGILPFCSFCNKIRDDKGYWETVDIFIHRHSEADISHSVCPECAKKHYPDMDLSAD